MTLTETLPAHARWPGPRRRICCGAGELVAFPTETVYGLGGDARSDLAVARIFDGQGAAPVQPVDRACARSGRGAATSRVFDARAEAVAAAFWPGPLTLVLPLRAECRAVAAGDGRAGHAWRSGCRRIRWRGACCAPLAGRWRHLRPTPRAGCRPTRAAHVLAGLSGRIAAVLDGGTCAVGVESTILGLDGPATRCCAPAACRSRRWRRRLAAACAEGGSAEKPTAPGQLASHYAPEAAVRLKRDGTASRARSGSGLAPCAAAALTLSAAGDLVEAAANLFHLLREADALAGPEGRIAFAPIPETGLGRAINDRLRRAAAPRGQGLRQM